MTTRVCHLCQATVPEKEFCPACTTGWKERPAAEKLTADEREAEMRDLNGPLEVPFGLIHERIEQLVGRPVWTHELGLNWEGLCKEARWESRPSTLQEVIDLIPAEKRLIVMVEDQ